jgi:GNAT superfamily N-acetyltransferase
MSTVTIRAAIAHEQQGLQALQRRASLANSGDREALLAHPDAIEVPTDQIVSGQVFVLESDGLVAGFAAVVPRGDGDAELDALFVEPHLQRRGFGRSLVDHCAQVALERGSMALHVIGNPHAREFYLSCGFASVGVIETRFGPALLMSRVLRP